MSNDVFVASADAAGKIQCAISLRDALIAIGLLPLKTELTLSANGRTITSTLADADGNVLSTSSITLPAGVAATAIPTQVVFEDGDLVLKNSAGTVLGSNPLVLPECTGV